MLWRESDSDHYGDITWFEKQMLAIARAYDSWKISRKMPTLITTELCKKAIDFITKFKG